MKRVGEAEKMRNEQRKFKREKENEMKNSCGFAKKKTQKTNSHCDNLLHKVRSRCHY